MKITKEEVYYIAKLAKLRIDDEQAEKLADQFQSIFNHFQSINQVNIKDLPAEKVEGQAYHLFRKDETNLFKEKEKIFSNVKSTKDGYIQVPRIIE